MCSKLFSSKRREVGVKPADDYATQADFCRLFNDQVGRLYLLSLLLTADHEKAEQCLLASLDDCMSSNAVFRPWAYSWAKRSVIKSAIRIIFASGEEAVANNLEGKLPDAVSVTDVLVSAMVTIKPFDRFVYVMAVLEKQSDRECSLLLNCSVHEVLDCKARAIQHLSDIYRTVRGPEQSEQTNRPQHRDSRSPNTNSVAAPSASECVSEPLTATVE